MATLAQLKNIAKAIGSTVDEARVLVKRYGTNVPEIMAARKAGRVGEAYEFGRTAGSFGQGVDTREDALQIMLELGQNRAYATRINPGDLLDMPEFDDYFTTYRNAVVDPKTGGLRKGVGITGKGRAGLSPKITAEAKPNTITQKIMGVEPFEGRNVTGELVEAALSNDRKRFAEAMAQRVSNQMALLSRIDMDAAAVATKYGLNPSSFYGPTGDLHAFISEVTGIPKQMISSAMAVASSGSSPYDELLKLSAAVPYIKMGKSGVKFDTAAALNAGAIKRSAKTGKYTGDPVFRVAKALERAMNGADPMVDDFGGLALKTFQYRNLGFLPDLADISVSDRIAQRLASGSFEGVADTQGLIYAASPDWVGSQAIAAAEGTTAAVPQEGDWFAQRLSELLKDTGGSRRLRIGQAFPFSQGEVADMFTSQRIPNLESRVVEGRRVGKSYKVPRGGRQIDPEAVEYAQQFESRGTPTTAMPFSDVALPPSLRTPENIDIAESGLILGKALGPMLQSMRTPRSYALAALAGLGGMGVMGRDLMPSVNQQDMDQASADEMLAAMARRNAARQVYAGDIT